MRDASGPVGPVFPVPYLPTLGPVHPDANISQLWNEVIGASATGRFLPHDKDARWGGAKNERVLIDDIAAAPGRIMVPTLRNRDREVLRAYYYGPLDIDEAREDATKLAAHYGADQARIVWLTPGPKPAAGRCCRIQLKTLAAEAPRQGRVGDLRSQTDHVQATWPAFAEAMASEGFGPLAQRMAAGRDDGPVLVAVAGGRIVGAIGPMATLPDPLGRLRLLPQYFGVLAEHRGLGHGRALWRAAMGWGVTNGAHYQLLQTQVGGASDRLCRAEGLETLGFVTVIAV